MRRQTLSTRRDGGDHGGARRTAKAEGERQKLFTAKCEKNGREKIEPQRKANRSFSP
jgi:hypothetical protein